MSLLKALVLIGGAIAQVPASDTVTDWGNIFGRPSTFPPSTHSHPISDVTGLQTALDAKAPLASPNFNSGNVTISAGHLVLDRSGDAAYTQFQIKGDAGQARDVGFFTGASTLRWTIRANSTAEGGSNSGSDLQIVSYNDAGIAITSPIQIARATGIVTFAASPVAPTPSAGDNSTKVATTAYVDTAVSAGFAANDAMVFKGTINASTNPNYPAADAGHVYRISVAGKIGGASGPNVEVGDTIYAITDGSAAGTHAAVGANWVIVQSNLDGAVIGPASVTSGNPVVFNGTTGKLVQEVTFAAFKTSLALNFTDLAGAVADAQLSGSYTGLAALTMSGALTIGGNIIGSAANLDIRTNTADAADTSATRIAGGGSVSSSTRGAYINLHGNEHATFPGDLRMASGITGGIFLIGAVDVSSALSVAGSLTFTGNLVWAGSVGNNMVLDTVDGSDSKSLSFGGGGGVSVTRGGYIQLFGNEHATSPGDANFVAGDTGDLSIIGSSKANAAIQIRNNTADGSDSGTINIAAGGGTANAARGAYIQMHGNEAGGTPGLLRLSGGTGVAVQFPTGISVTGGNFAITGVITGILFGSKTHDWPSVLNNQTSSTTVAVTGAAVGDAAIAWHTQHVAGILLYARVTGANTVTVYLQNQTGATQDLASGTLSVLVFGH